MLFSIITTVYNNLKYVKNAVLSVVNQDFDDYEYIIIDDGSSDGTSELLDDLASEYPKIKLIHQSNKGIYGGYNTGIKNSCGKYIFIVNSDDCLVEGSLKYVSEKIENYSYPDVVFQPVVLHRCDNKQNIIERNYKEYAKHRKETIYSSAEEVRKAWIDLYMDRLAFDPINFYKREIVTECLFHEREYISDDILFNIRIAPRIRSALVIDRTCYEYYNYIENDEMNASIGKFYQNAHEMYETIYYTYRHQFEDWNVADNYVLSCLARKRLQHVSSELSGLSAKNCYLSFENKIKYIFDTTLCETVFKCTDTIDAWAELGRRVVFGVNEIARTDKNVPLSQLRIKDSICEALQNCEDITPFIKTSDYIKTVDWD